MVGGNEKMTKNKVKTLRGQSAYLEAMKKENPKVEIIEGFKYVRVGDSLIPQYGRIANKSDLNLIESQGPSASAWAAAVKLLNGVK